MSKSVVRIGRRGKGVESAGEQGREGRHPLGHTEVLGHGVA